MKRARPILALMSILMLTVPLAACAEGAKDTNGKPAAKDAGAAGESAAAGAGEAAGETAAANAAREMAYTGVLSEEEFKALHHLKTGEPPELHGTMIDLAGGHAYLSLPEGEPPFPGIVVIQEWWGLNDNIKLWSDRLAAEGYAAIAVDLYDGKVATTPDDAMKYMKAVDGDRALGILEAGFDFLGSDPRIRATRRGCIGWCFGGGWSLQLALHEPDLKACVMYYGRPVDDPAELKKMKAPLLGVFGNEDTSIPPTAVDAFEKALTEAGVDHRIYRYDAVHAFANPSNARYDFDAAEDAWSKVVTFLAQNLKK